MTKVLIFESDHAFAVELRTELSMLGCTVQVFKEGATGLMAAAQSPPDLALISADLRPLNGFSICNKLKKDPAFCNVSVILMSADQAPETFEQHRKLKSRADDYVHKPIATSELIERIRAIVPLVPLVPQGPPAARYPLGTARVPSDERAPVSSEAQRSDASAGFLLYGLGEGDEEEATTAGPSPGMLAEGLGIRSAPPSAQLVLELPSKARASSEPEPAAFVDDEVSIVFDEPTFEPPDALELIAALGSSPRAAAPIPQSAPASLSVAPAAPADPANQAAVLQLRKSLVEAHQELQRMRPQLTELGRLRTELAEVRRELAETRDTAVVAASRELAGLRDELQKREHSLLDLREETSARQRELLDSRAQHATLTRELGIARQRSFSLERQTAETIARLDAALADKSLAERTTDDLKEIATSLTDQLQARTGELRHQREAHERELTQGKTEQLEAARQIEESLRKELAAAERQHAVDTAEFRARLADAEAAAETGRGEVEARRVGAEAETSRVASEREAAAMAHGQVELARAEERHAAAFAERDAEHASALGRLRMEHQDGLLRDATQRAEQLASLQDHVRIARLDAAGQTLRAEEVTGRLEVAERHRTQLATRTTELELDVRRARDEVDDALRRCDAFEADRAAAQLADGNARREREDLTARIASLDAEHAALFAAATEAHLTELAQLRSERDECARSTDTQGARALELERQLAEQRDRVGEVDAIVRRAAAEHDEKLARTEERRVADLAAAEGQRRAEREAFEAQLTKLRGDLQTAQAGLQRARERWNADRVALQKARDAITSLIAASEPHED